MRFRRLSAIFVVAPVLLSLCAPALVGHAQLLSTEDAFLSGFQENLPVVSPGTGFFSADINADVINYQLLYVIFPPLSRRPISTWAILGPIDPSSSSSARILGISPQASRPCPVRRQESLSWARLWRPTCCRLQRRPHCAVRR